jgi:hypothetical protein
MIHYSRGPTAADRHEVAETRSARRRESALVGWSAGNDSPHKNAERAATLWPGNDRQARWRARGPHRADAPGRNTVGSTSRSPRASSPVERGGLSRLVPIRRQRAGRRVHRLVAARGAPSFCARRFWSIALRRWRGRRAAVNAVGRGGRRAVRDSNPSCGRRARPRRGSARTIRAHALRLPSVRRGRRDSACASGRLGR